MKVKLGQAVKVFFGNSSLPMVYSEAVANALDANATNINIKIDINALNMPDSLKIEISDNGVGFTDERCRKFCNLLDIDEKTHKGIGRLVYLCYFSKVNITSLYGSGHKRTFEFSDKFDGDCGNPTLTTGESENGTTITMTDYTMSKIKSCDFILPKNIKSTLLEMFYSQLYQLKKKEQRVKINISSRISNETFNALLSTDDIPDLIEKKLEDNLNIFDELYLYYSIKKTTDIPSIITAISVDNRNQSMDIIAKENIIPGYEMVFLLYSKLFDCTTDVTRQNLEPLNIDIKSIKTIFRKGISDIISKELPIVAENKANIKESLANHFPHLTGYFEDRNIGFASRKNILEEAQKTFFDAQRDILEATSLTPEQYNSALELSSRTLTEYILFRQQAINKLSKINADNKEVDIHNIIIPQKQQLTHNNFIGDLYCNNSWILDDKYMTYANILSDKEMKDLISTITNGEVFDDDANRPDIAFIFSNNPNDHNLVDVVIVELKKKGIKLAKTEEVISQLKQRARKLMQYYPDRIQRIWFYGIVEFTDEFKVSLKEEQYIPIFSKGTVYYKENQIYTNLELGTQPHLIGTYIMDLDSLIKDANARNSTFLNLIKSKFKSENSSQVHA